MSKLPRIICIVSSVLGCFLGLLYAVAYIDVIGTSFAPKNADSLALAGLIIMGLSVLALISLFVFSKKPFWSGIVIFGIGISGIATCIILARYIDILLSPLLFILAGLLIFRSYTKTSREV